MTSERIFAMLLGGGLVAALLWKLTPPNAAPVDTIASAATLGQPTVTPTYDAAALVGMSYGPDDGDAGPAVYCAAYPGVRPRMPAIPSAVK